jgi:hypothetical protein
VHYTEIGFGTEDSVTLYKIMLCINIISPAIVIVRRSRLPPQPLQIEDEDDEDEGDANESSIVDNSAALVPSTNVNTSNRNNKQKKMKQR